MTDTMVYRIKFGVGQYQVLLFDLPDPDAEGLFDFDGTPKLGGWGTPPVYVPRPRQERPDIWFLIGADTMAMTEMTAALVEPFVSSSGELLPLALSGSNEKLFALNVLGTTDCIDPAAYSFQTSELYPQFVEGKLPRSGLFKIPQTRRTRIYCVERATDEVSFRQQVENYSLTGIGFEAIWSTAEGAKPINLLRE